VIEVHEHSIISPVDINVTYLHGLNIGVAATDREVKDFLFLIDWLIDLVNPSDVTKFQLKMNYRAKTGFGLAVRRSGWFRETMDPEEPILEKYRGIPVVIDNSIANNYVCGMSCNCTEIYLICPTALHISQFNAKLVGIRAV
jgi:hypothetical protein